MKRSIIIAILSILFIGTTFSQEGPKIDSANWQNDTILMIQFSNVDSLNSIKVDGISYQYKILKQNVASVHLITTEKRDQFKIMIIGADGKQSDPYQLNYNLAEDSATEEEEEEVRLNENQIGIKGDVAESTKKETPTITLDTLQYPRGSKINISLNIPADTSAMAPQYLRLVQEIGLSINALRQAGHRIKSIKVKNHLNQKLLEKEEKSGTVENLSMPITIDGVQARQFFDNKEANIKNAWLLELYKLAILKKQLISQHKLDSKLVQLEVITKFKKKEWEPLSVYIDAGLNQFNLTESISYIQFREALPETIESLFNEMEFEQIDNVNAFFDKENQRLVFSFSNYESAYSGLEDIEQLIAKIKPLLTRLDQANAIERVEYHKFSYENFDFLQFPSELEYEGEFGDSLDQQYTLLNMKSKEESVESESIMQGEISILQQELLKFISIDHALDINAKRTLKIKYNSGRDDIKTKLIFYLMDP